MAIVAVGLKIAFIAVLVPWIFNFLTATFGGFFYQIALALFKIIDLLQDLFRKLAGLEPVYISSGGLVGTSGTNDNVIVGLLTSSKVVEILITMTMFAVALLIIATIVQLIRVEYTTEGAKNSKGSILGLAIKSLGMFVAIPLLCVIGVGVSTTLLKAVDRATSYGGGASISGSIFLAGAAEASPLRTLEADWVSSGFLVGGNGPNVKVQFEEDKLGIAGSSKTADLFDLFNVTKSGNVDQQRATLASAVDSSFSASKNDCVKITASSEWGAYQEGQALYYGNLESVKYFYNFGDMNFLVIYVGAGFALTCLFKACFGLVMRMYKVTALFIISPGVIALQPLDGGNAYKSWRKNFIGSVLGAYGIVISLNLFFFLIGVINTIKLFPETTTAEILLNAPINYWVRTVFTLVGLLMINDLSALISGYIGGEDTLKSGEAMAKNVGGQMAKIGGSVTKFAIAGKSLLASKMPKNAAERALNKEAKAKGQLSKATEDKNKFVAEKGIKLDKDGNPDLNSITNSADRTELENLINAEKSAEENFIANKASLSTKDREKAGARAAKRQANQLIFNEMFTDSIKNSSVVSLANKMTGGFVKDFGGKSMAGVMDKVTPGNEEIFGMAANYKPGKVGKFLGTAGDIVSGNWASNVDNTINDKRDISTRSKISGANLATAHYTTGKEAIEALDPHVILSENNANLQRQYQELAKILKANANDPDEAKKQAAPIVAAIEKLTKQLAGKTEGDAQRTGALSAVKAELGKADINSAGITNLSNFAGMASTDNRISNAKFTQAGYDQLQTEHAKLTEEFNKSVTNYIEKQSEKTLKTAMNAFERNTGVSGSASKLDSIIAAYTKKMQESADKAAAKAAEKAYQTSLAKMIAKFSKK